MDYTSAQKDKLKSLHSVFGSAVKRASSRLVKTGWVHVELESAAGVWHWDIDSDGKLVQAVLISGLFDDGAYVRLFDASREGEVSATQSLERKHDPTP